MRQGRECFDTGFSQPEYSMNYIKRQDADSACHATRRATIASQCPAISTALIENMIGITITVFVLDTKMAGNKFIKCNSSMKYMHICVN